MWKPEERIRFAASLGHVPTREEAAASLLFSPIDVGPLRLEQRTWVPAMVPWRATEDGFVTDAVCQWYARFARGRPGAIVIEATGVRDIPSGPLLRIGHDRFIPGLTRLVDAVREASRGHTRLLIQLIDFLSIRRRPERARFLNQFLAITERHRQSPSLQGLDDAAIRARLIAMSEPELDDVLSARELEALRYGARERVTDTQLPHVRDLPVTLPGLFADAAARACVSGFDGIELHYAHAYTMASFLSAANDRADGYGGSRGNRVKLPLEVFDAVRSRIGHAHAVGCRYLTDECIEGGSDVDDAVFFARAFARAGMDFISTSRGGKFDDAKQPAVGSSAYPYTGRSGYECMPHSISDARGPFGRNVDPTKIIRTAIRANGFATPVVCGGGVHNFTMAETMLSDDVCDIVAAARQSLADPDWFLKFSLGYGEAVRSCCFTNYCEGLDQKHKTVTCQLWDKALPDENAPRTGDGKRRLVAPEWIP